MDCAVVVDRPTGLAPNSRSSIMVWVAVRFLTCWSWVNLLLDWKGLAGALSPGIAPGPLRSTAEAQSANDPGPPSSASTAARRASSLWSASAPKPHAARLRSSAASRTSSGAVRRHSILLKRGGQVFNRVAKRIHGALDVVGEVRRGGLSGAASEWAGFWVAVSRDSTEIGHSRLILRVPARSFASKSKSARRLFPALVGVPLPAVSPMRAAVPCGSLAVDDREHVPAISFPSGARKPPNAVAVTALKGLVGEGSHPSNFSHREDAFELEPGKRLLG